MLGGSAIHARNGVVDDKVDSEPDAFARARRFLSYLPASVDSPADRGQPPGDRDRRDEWLLRAIPRARRQPYDARRVVEAVVDRGTFFEIGALPLQDRRGIPGRRDHRSS